jgi:hypothetical protein
MFKCADGEERDVEGRMGAYRAMEGYIRASEHTAWHRMINMRHVRACTGVWESILAKI